MTTALIDADLIAYRCAVTAEKDFGDEVWTDVQTAISDACMIAEEWASRADCDEILLVFSPDTRRNYRKPMSPLDYKTHRKAKPVSYHQVVHGMRARFRHYDIDGLEADDTLGILHTRDPDESTCVISIDKDLLTVPGLLFNPNKHHFPEDISPQEATWNWFYQTLIGDSADGFKGAPGIGPKKAEQVLPRGKPLLREPTYVESLLWDIVLEVFRAKFDDADTAFEQAILNARLARILHYRDYDHATGTIRLWHPDTPLRLQLSDFQITGDWHDA